MIYGSDRGITAAEQCVVRLLDLGISDPDPLAMGKYIEEFGCADCDYHPTWVKVLNALLPKEVK